MNKRGDVMVVEKREWTNSNISGDHLSRDFDARDVEAEIIELGVMHWGLVCVCGHNALSENDF